MAGSRHSLQRIDTSQEYILFLYRNTWKEEAHKLPILCLSKIHTIHTNIKETVLPGDKKRTK